MKKEGKIDSLQILRAIAFLEIFLGHCGITCFTGAFGVSIFVVLSGFCMAINYLPKIEKMKISLVDNIKYAISKVKKLYGLHLFMIGCAFLLARMPSSADAIKRLLMDALLVQCWSPYAEDYFSYNGVAWYLSAYLFICIAAPDVIRFLSKFKEKKQVLFGSAVVYAGMVAVGMYVSRVQIPVGDHFAFWLTYISPVYRVFEFFLGAALGWLYSNSRNEVKNGTLSATMMEVLTAAMFAGIIWIFHRMEGVYDGLCYTALFTPVSMVLVIVFANSRGLVLRLLDNRFLLWLGNLSTYTFLIHQVVIRWLVTVLDRNVLGNVYTIVLTILSFAITVLGAEIVLIIIRKNRRL